MIRPAPERPVRLGRSRGEPDIEIIIRIFGPVRSKGDLLDFKPGPTFHLDSGIARFNRSRALLDRQARITGAI